FCFEREKLMMEFFSLLSIFFLLVGFFLLFRSLRAWIYDFFIVRMTSQWYKKVLERMEKGSTMVDIGIGTGAALIANKSILFEKDLKVVGIDYDLDYVRRCRELISKNGLRDRIQVLHISVYDYEGGPFDVAYFRFYYFDDRLIFL